MRSVFRGLDQPSLLIIAVGCVRFKILKKHGKSDSDAPIIARCVSCVLVSLSRRYC